MRCLRNRRHVRPLSAQKVVVSLAPPPPGVQHRRDKTRKFPPFMQSIPKILLGIPLCLSAAAADLHVSPAGNDSNPGTKDRPLATFDGARKAARPLAGKEPVNVWFHDGVYYLPDTVRFEHADSGTSSAPVVYAGRLRRRPRHQSRPQRRHASCAGVETRRGRRVHRHHPRRT